MPPLEDLYENVSRLQRSATQILNFKHHGARLKKLPNKPSEIGILQFSLHKN